MFIDVINKVNEVNLLGIIKIESLVKLVKLVLSSESVKKIIGELFIYFVNNFKIYEKVKLVGELLYLVF